MLDDNGISTADAQIQLLTSETTDVVTVQVEETSPDEARRR